MKYWESKLAYSMLKYMIQIAKSGKMVWGSELVEKVDIMANDVEFAHSRFMIFATCQMSQSKCYRKSLKHW